MTEEGKPATEQVQADEPEAAEENEQPAREERGPVTLSAAEAEDLRKRAEERDEYLNMLQRTHAEFQNYQKRIQRDREQERKYYAGAILGDFLPVLDNLERALSAAEDAEEDSFFKGVRMVQAQFLELLNKHGVEPIDAVGQPFDSNLHEALTQQPSEEHPANTIMHVAATGYKIHERVLRPAQVVVSSGAGE